MGYLDVFDQHYSLRTYQKEHIQELEKAFAQGKRKPMVQSPTGSGKSLEIVYLALKALDKAAQKSTQSKILIVCPNENLIRNLEKYFKTLKVPYGIIQGNTQTNWFAPIVIASSATLHKRLETIPVQFNYVILDEAHFGKAASWDKFIHFFWRLPYTYYTATPERLDGKGFEDIADHLITSPSIGWFIDQGYLSPYKFFVKESTARKFTMRGGEFALNEQNDEFNKEIIINGLVEAYAERCLGQRAIAFATTVDHSQKIAAAYNKFGQSYYGRDIAAHVDANTTQEEMDKLFEHHEAGDLLVLTNVQKLTVGVDLPWTSCLQFARLTASVALAFQMIGRGLRKNPSDPNKVCSILDHVGFLESFVSKNGVEFRDEYPWCLEGAKKRKQEQDKTLFCCNPKCKACLGDKAQLAKQNPDGLVVCPECLTINPLPKRERDKGDPIEGTSETLVELSLSNTQLKINSIIRKALERNPQVKPWALVMRVVEVPGLTESDFVYFCEKTRYHQKGYQSGFAKTLYPAYQVLHTKGLDRASFYARMRTIFRFDSNDFQKNCFWESYQKLHKLSPGTKPIPSNPVSAML